jgi:hypothetical protein
MFKLKVVHGGREIEIEIPMKDDRWLDSNTDSAIKIIKETVEQMIKLNQ